MQVIRSCSSSNEKLPPITGEVIGEERWCVIQESILQHCNHQNGGNVGTNIAAMPEIVCGFRNAITWHSRSRSLFSIAFIDTIAFKWGSMEVEDGKQPF